MFQNFLNASVMPELLTIIWKVPELQILFQNCLKSSELSHLCIVIEMFILLRKKQGAPFHVYWPSVHYTFSGTLDNIFYFLQIHEYTGGYILSRTTRTLPIHSRRTVFHCVHNDNGMSVDAHCFCKFDVKLKFTLEVPRRPTRGVEV